MVDPQDPDILANWCPQCCEHVDYNTIERRYTDSQGRSSRTDVDICKKCESDNIFRPSRQEGKLESKGCLGVVLIIAASLVVATLISNSKEVGDLIYFLASLLLISIFAAVLFYVPSYFRLKKWKKWAKERGWEDVEDDS
tara:strand:+ start:97 stop:516 length:420 start_codon:yes stop_codon:yes gene_type:complete